MYRPILNTALIAAFVSIIGKMIYHLFLQEIEDADMYTRFFYLFCFLLALLIGLRSWKSAHPGSPLTKDVKSGMQVTSVYALVVAVFTYAYYEWINPTYFASRIQERVDFVAETASPEELDQVRNTAEFIFSAFIHSTITLFGLMVIGFFYTLILVMILRMRPTSFKLS